MDVLLGAWRLVADPMSKPALDALISPERPLKSR
jgi:hypothetical protein